jgi:hypothetical protein
VGERNQSIPSKLEKNVSNEQVQEISKLGIGEENVDGGILDSGMRSITETGSLEMVQESKRCESIVSNGLYTNENKNKFMNESLANEMEENEREMELIQNMIQNAEKPIHYTHQRKMALTTQDDCFFSEIASQYYTQLSVYEQEPDLKRFVPRRTPKTFDYSKTKAPPLPKTPQHVQVRNPNMKIDPAILLRKLLLIRKQGPFKTTCYSAESNRSQISAKLGLQKKGPYYQEPFEASHVPIQLGIPMKKSVEDEWNLLDTRKQVLETKEELLQQHEFIEQNGFRRQPGCIYEPIMIDSCMKKVSIVSNISRPQTTVLFPFSKIDHELEPNKSLFSEPFIPVYPTYLNQQKTHVPSKELKQEINHVVPLMELPPSTIRVGNNMCSIFAGVDTFPRNHSRRTLFRETFYRYGSSGTQDTNQRYTRIYIDYHWLLYVHQKNHVVEQNQSHPVNYPYSSQK